MELKYQQLQDALKAELKSGKFKPGDKFYTDRELMKKYKYSLVTVTRALTEMTEQGYFKRIRKLGTFVQESTEIPGMSGNVMTKTLYISGTPSADFRTNILPWFVADEVRRGIINSYPGPVCVEPLEELTERRKSGEDFLAVIVTTTGLGEVERKIFSDDIVVDIGSLVRRASGVISYEPLSGIFDAIRYLVLELDHQRIGFVGGESRVHSGRRYAAYRIALESLELPFDESLVILNTLDGADATRKLLALSNPPTAIFLVNDIRAMNAIEVIRETGLRVPEDISILGADGMPGADTFTPPLTTIKVPFSDMGKTAVEMLMEKLKKGKTGASKIFHCDLIVRESTAPVRKAKKKQ